MHITASAPLSVRGAGCRPAVLGIRRSSSLPRGDGTETTAMDTTSAVGIDPTLSALASLLRVVPSQLPLWDV